MKILKHVTRKNGNRIVTIELSKQEADVSYEIKVIHHDTMYKLGHPIDDIVHGNQITEARPVQWCVVGQEWVE